MKLYFLSQFIGTGISTLIYNILVSEYDIIHFRPKFIIGYKIKTMASKIVSEEFKYYKHGKFIVYHTFYI